MLSYIPHINLNDYDYDLPQERIAQHPLDRRQASRLLVFEADKGSILHRRFADISEILPASSLLVLNKTRVIAARLMMRKVSGGAAELLCTEPLEPSTDPAIALQSKGTSRWKALVGGRNIKTGTSLVSSDNEKFSLKAVIIEKTGSEALVELTWDSGCSFSEVLDLLGKTPLPPYIKRDSEPDDKLRYQTVYASSDGSVAAPTAGLHFDEELLNKILAKGIETCPVVLHVGLGTFKPIEKESIANHDMHSEQFFVDKKSIELIISHLDSKKPVIATGTTTARVLESLYWIGAQRLIETTDTPKLITFLSQWEPYRLARQFRLPTATEAYESLLEFINQNNSETIAGSTQLFIVPGYDFKVIDGLITNFHLPGSTLILLVAAFTGRDNWKRIYTSALENGYRFLSYGDGSLLLR